MALYFFLGSVSTIFAFLVGFFIAWLLCPYLPSLTRFIPVKEEVVVVSGQKKMARPFPPDEMDEIMQRIKEDEQLSDLKEYYQSYLDHKDNNGWLMQ